MNPLVIGVLLAAFGATIITRQIEIGYYYFRALVQASNLGSKLTKRFDQTKPIKALDPCKIGAVGELAVSRDLLRRGFEVFRTVSHTSSCDLVAIRPIAVKDGAELKYGKVIRVEVKTGKVDPITHKVSVPRNLDKTRYDLLAVAANDEVYYYPDLMEV